MQQHGLKLPDDVSVIGMDDLALCRIVTPNLDSIRVPRKEMGRTAVQQLLQENNCVLKTFVNIEPVKRESIRIISE